MFQYIDVIYHALGLSCRETCWEVVLLLQHISKEWSACHMAVTLCLFWLRLISSYLVRNFKQGRNRRCRSRTPPPPPASDVPVVLGALHFWSDPQLIGKGVLLGFIPPRQVLMMNQKGISIWNEEHSHLNTTACCMVSKGRCTQFSAPLIIQLGSLGSLSRRQEIQAWMCKMRRPSLPLLDSPCMICIVASELQVLA